MRGRTPPPPFAQDSGAFAFDTCDSGKYGCYISTGTLWGQAMLFFFTPWFVFYYLWVFKSGDKTNDRSFQVLYDRVTTQGMAAKGLQKVLSKLKIDTTHDKFKKALYAGLHYGTGMITCALATLFWHSYTAHSAFLIAIAGASIWNASGFYFNVFSSRQAPPGSAGG